MGWETRDLTKYHEPLLRLAWAVSLVFFLLFLDLSSSSSFHVTIEAF
jgi:hypothetical protein